MIDETWCDGTVEGFLVSGAPEIIEPLSRVDHPSPWRLQWLDTHDGLLET
ncbi:hypothetical protein [Acetobacter nitrogenifigens]|nr:hypothetical protein [Acetobacter nitrogenifigens]